MAVYIGQASCDEHGRYVGGQSGNQSGTELNTRAWWDNGWNAVIRINNSDGAARCAAADSGAVSSMCIGYDQGKRNTLLPLAEACGWNLSAVASACECDCTSLASVCLIAGGLPKSAMYADGNLAYTGNIVSRAEGTGLVSVFSSPDYLRSSTKLKLGDVLVSSGHAVIVTSGATGGNAGGTATSGVSGDVTALARAVIAGRHGVGDARRAALGDKYEAVQAEVNRLLAGGANAVGTSTGTARLIAGTYKVVCDSLNVRSAPSLRGSVVTGYGRGERIYSVAADTAQADGYVRARYTGFSGATRYIAIGTASGIEKYFVKV